MSILFCSRCFFVRFSKKCSFFKKVLEHVWTRFSMLKAISLTEKALNRSLVLGQCGLGYQTLPPPAKHRHVHMYLHNFFCRDGVGSQPDGSSWLLRSKAFLHSLRYWTRLFFIVLIATLNECIFLEHRLMRPM